MLSAISNQSINFTKGLFALLMAQDHQTAFLQVTNEIHIQSSIPIIQPIFTLDVSLPYQGTHRGNLLTSGHIHGLSLAKPRQKILRVLSCHFLSVNTCIELMVIVPTVNATWVTGSTITFLRNSIQLNNGMIVHHIQ